MRSSWSRCDRSGWVVVDRVVGQKTASWRRGSARRVGIRLSGAAHRPARCPGAAPRLRRGVGDGVAARPSRGRSPRAGLDQRPGTPAMSSSSPSSRLGAAPPPGGTCAYASASRAPVSGRRGAACRGPGADARARHERLHRVAAERHDQRRIEHLELAPQVRRAGGDLVRLRVAVAGRAALDDVGDEDLVAAPADAIQQLTSRPPARPTNGRPSRSSLKPGPSPTNTTSVSGLPSPGTACVRGTCEPAAGADPDLGRDRLERRAGARAVGSRRRRPARRAARAAAGASQPRSTRSSAIWTALVAAPLRRLSLTTQNARPRSSSIDGSWRTRPTKISSRAGGIGGERVGRWSPGRPGRRRPAPRRRARGPGPA